MNKADLITEVSQRTQTSKACVERVFAAAHTAAVEALRRDEKITISGVGRVQKIARAPRTGRNPSTGESVRIPARITVRFCPSKKLDEEVSCD